MNFLIGFLLIIAFSSVFSSERWPENEIGFVKYQRKIALSFEEANIQYLSSDLLNRLSAVEYLAFYNGNISKVYVKPELKHLQMTSTKTNELEIDTSKTHQIAHLDIRGGLLQAIPRHIHRLTNLTILNLHGNKIETVIVDEIKGLKKLRSLILSGNIIKELDATFEINLPNLEELSLFGNYLTKLEMCGWELPKLTKLDLKFNQLSHVLLNPEDFSRLLTIDLSFNRLDCAWRQKFQEKNSEITVKVGGFCQEYHPNIPFPVDCGTPGWSKN